MDNCQKSDTNDIICNSQFSSRSVNDLLVLLSTKKPSFDNVSECSEVSIISHPFSDEIPQKLATRDHQFSFSSFYTETVDEMNREFTKENSVCSTCDSCSTCSVDFWNSLGIDIDKVQIQPQQLSEGIKRTLLAKINNFKINKIKYSKKKVEKIRTSKFKTFDTLSGVWKMLMTSKEFIVTPPGFSAFRQGKPHWLDQEAIPWLERENARRKCATWLHKYHQHM